jgi:hypothetical protein
MDPADLAKTREKLSQFREFEAEAFAEFENASDPEARAYFQRMSNSWRMLIEQTEHLVAQIEARTLSARH